ncbi:hypothetical protein GCM10010329_85250 [Streptomyces spiroverticillatus]|uniref:Uncharacterized protein n=1 Tax=Streptomyces finlayi TaxID=67296 RepID=A0A918XA55_9ACTN|nr:hypothetical protein GCM10010329_85250 [Streptomyces spiroverticillatus]GHD19481.1 hypothetical protein GCM10010334_83180 [Streptomyces finlayi]
MQYSEFDETHEHTADELAELDTPTVVLRRRRGADGPVWATSTATDFGVPDTPA